MSAHEPAGAAGDWCLERGSADGQCGSPVPAHRGRPYGIATLRNGFSWIFTDFHGFSWIFMDFHGFSWILMDFNGF